MCSGEGGILPEGIKSSYKYIFEYVPNEYSVTEENLKKVDAIEIKFGQSAKPGMGGHLPVDETAVPIEIDGDRAIVCNFFHSLSNTFCSGLIISAFIRLV